VRDAAHMTGSYRVRASQPPDVLGLYVFMPASGQAAGVRA
jgi:hypothetical protein